jgi:predicted AAA+ superfamily ATPase
LLGARRIGKTTLIKQIIEQNKEPYLLLNGEDIETIDVLKKRSVENYKRLLGKNRFLIIDEAQKIPGIGSALKLMVDEINELKILVTGSSVFDLNNQLGEPLTGRKITFHVFPLAQMELSAYENIIQTKGLLEDRLVFGSYPELFQYESKEEKTQYLKELVNSYLLKDILAFENIRNSNKLLDLLRLLAFQMGKEVSMDELGRQLGISKNTVERYLDLLSKVFVIYRLKGFSRNLRNEISKSSKWYFYDNGIRNTLIANHNSIALRNDVGELWENYLLSERIKFQNYSGMLVNNYFWRTYQQQEIDFIEEREGKLYAYEVKWNPTKKIKEPAKWKEGYPDSKFEVITPDNYLSWIGA